MPNSTNALKLHIEKYLVDTEKFDVLGRRVFTLDWASLLAEPEAKLLVKGAVDDLQRVQLKACDENGCILDFSCPTKLLSFKHIYIDTPSMHLQGNFQLLGDPTLRVTCFSYNSCITTDDDSNHVPFNVLVSDMRFENSDTSVESCFNFSNTNVTFTNCALTNNEPDHSCLKFWGLGLSSQEVVTLKIISSSLYSESMGIELMNACQLTLEHVDISSYSSALEYTYFVSTSQMKRLKFSEFADLTMPRNSSASFFDVTFHSKMNLFSIPCWSTTTFSNLTYVGDYLSLSDRASYLEACPNLFFWSQVPMESASDYEWRIPHVSASMPNIVPLVHLNLAGDLDLIACLKKLRLRGLYLKETYDFAQELYVNTSSLEGVLAKLREVLPSQGTDVRKAVVTVAFDRTEKKYCFSML